MRPPQPEYVMKFAVFLLLLVCLSSVIAAPHDNGHSVNELARGEDNPDDGEPPNEKQNTIPGGSRKKNPEGEEPEGKPGGPGEGGPGEGDGEDLSLEGEGGGKLSAGGGEEGKPPRGQEEGDGLQLQAGGDEELQGHGRLPPGQGGDEGEGGAGEGRPGGGRPEGGRPEGGRPEGGRPEGGRPEGGRPGGERPGGERPGEGRPGGGSGGEGASAGLGAAGAGGLALSSDASIAEALRLRSLLRRTQNAYTRLNALRDRQRTAMLRERPPVDTPVEVVETGVPVETVPVEQEVVLGPGPVVPDVPCVAGLDCIGGKGVLKKVPGAGAKVAPCKLGRQCTFLFQDSKVFGPFTLKGIYDHFRETAKRVKLSIGGQDILGNLMGPIFAQPTLLNKRK